MSKIRSSAPRRNRYQRFQAATQVFNRNVNLIVVSPNGEPGQFAAHDDRGRQLVPSSRQPLLDACRVLLSEGVDPNAWAIMRHHDSEVDALRGKVGIAARLSVEENRHGTPAFRPYRKGRNGVGKTPPMRSTAAPVQFSSGAGLAR